MRLLVVIVNYRVADLTIDCLRSVSKEIATLPETKAAVCENGTGDDSAQKIQEAIDTNGWTSWCELTASYQNLGFTGGNNLVIRSALQSADQPQYVLLLNPDTIVRPNAFHALLEFMDKNPGVGIAGCRLEQPNGTPHRSAFRFQTPLSEFETNIRLGLISRLLRRWIVAPPVRDDAFQTDWVSGACMMIRKEVFADIGLLDEGFFTYFDDCDFCYNASQKGWLTWYVPTGRVVHLEGQSSGVGGGQRKRLPAYYFQARQRFFLKNRGPLFAAFCDFAQIAGHLLWRLRITLTGEDGAFPLRYLSDAIRNSVFVTGFKVRKVRRPDL